MDWGKSFKKFGQGFLIIIAAQVIAILNSGITNYEMPDDLTGATVAKFVTLPLIGALLNWLRNVVKHWNDPR